MPTEVSSSNRILYIEPTDINKSRTESPYSNGYVAPIEDYSISATLEAVLTDRKSCGMPDADGTNTRVFTTSLNGVVSYSHGEHGVLTTEYTNATATKPEENTDECFGMTSINVSYDMGSPGQAFAPVVNITFVDVRGYSVMAKEESHKNSLYSALIMFPSPLFKLSIKGFYGDEITYNLALSHPVKISFDANTGNFTIAATFRGYMFGIYNDLPLSYAVIAPFMDYVGKDYWNNQVQNGVFSFKNGDVSIPMITFPEFRLKIAQAAASEPSKVLEEQYQSNLSSSDMEKTDAYKITASYPLRDWKEKDNIIYLISETAPDAAKAKYKADIESFYDGVKEYDDNASHNVKFGDIFEFLGTYALGKQIESYTFTKADNNDSYFLDEPVLLTQSNYSLIKDKVQSDITGHKAEGGKFFLYVVMKSSTDTENVSNKISKRLQQIDNLANKAKEEYQKVKNQMLAEALGFPPTIKNMFRMIFAHMETFMRVMYSCFGVIKSQMDSSTNTERNISTYNMTIEDTDVDNVTGILPPFPLFTKARTIDKDMVTETVWPGEIDNSTQLEELKVTESLIAGAKLYSTLALDADRQIQAMNPKKEGEEAQEYDVRATVTDDPFKNKDLKLSTYLTLKNIYDRWLCSTPETRWRLSDCQEPDLSYEDSYRASDFDNFFFIDTFYHNIGHRLIVDSTDISDLISSSLPDGGVTGDGGKITFSNHTVYEYMYEIATHCGGNLLALPMMFGIKDNASLEKMFRCIPYTSKVNRNAATTYVFLYAYKLSEQLATGAEKVDDGFLVSEPDLLPASLHDNNGNKITAFGVTYAKQNQPYFKNISFASDKYGITDRALAKTMEITASRSKGPRETSLYAQNIYSVYSNMQYSCTVTMMGDAQIMPMMYFQLNNIPYWKGTYMINSVSHSISPGQMETTFTGVRINRNAIPMTNDATITFNECDWSVAINNKQYNYSNTMAWSEYPDSELIKIKNSEELNRGIAIRDRLMRELGWKEYMAAALIGCIYGESGGWKPWAVNVGEKAGTLTNSSACYKGPRLKPSDMYDGAYSYGAGLIQWSHWNRKLKAVTIVASKNDGNVHGMEPSAFLKAIDGIGTRNCIHPYSWQKSSKKVDYKGGIENLSLDEQFTIIIGELTTSYSCVNKSMKTTKNLQEALAVVYCDYIGGYSGRVRIPSPADVWNKVKKYMNANSSRTTKSHYERRLGYAKNFLS